MRRTFGTGRDKPSARDWRYRVRPSTVGRLPESIDLRAHCPPAYNQLHLNSCSANALAAAMRFDEIRDGRADLPAPSRLFIYYNERLLGGAVGSDVPVSLRDGYRLISRFGACDESLWPYQPRRFRRLPTPECYRSAARHLAIAYYRIRRSLAHLRACLAEGYPFVFAVAVHKSMLSRAVARTGAVPVPGRRDALVGGHAVVAVGYDDAARRFIVRNSWGRTWGLRGDFHLPYAFMASAALTWDFWTMRRVS